MYHKIEMIGRLGRDPETRITPTGKTLCELSVATDWYDGEQTKTVWFRVTVWGNMAEVASKSLRKGHLVFVSGNLVPDDTGNPRAYIRKNGEPAANFEVNASKILFLSPKGYGQSDEDIF